MSRIESDPQYSITIHRIYRVLYVTREVYLKVNLKKNNLYFPYILFYIVCRYVTDFQS